jgi:hypothetical protein
MFSIALVALLTLIGLHAPLLAPVAAPPNPDVYAGIRLELRDEGVDQTGRWYQTFRATIRPGGTISDVAIAVYNDILRTDDVFKAAQQNNPNLTNPAFVYVGQIIDLTIDPTQVSVFKETQREQNGTVRKHLYYNGVVETYFGDPKSGVLRTIDFPADKRATNFIFFDEFEGVEEHIAARPGTRLVDYRYVQGDSFGDVARKAFGVNSVKAANALLSQSGWDPNAWPPSGEGRTRLVRDTQISYDDQRPQVLEYTPADAAARDAWARLNVEREAVGIYPARMEKDGIVYQIMIGSGSTTAKQVSRLLFNGEEHAVEIARIAGLPVPADPAQVPPDYNPFMVGRTFEFKVPFAQERFALVEKEPAKDGALVTRLANGTVIYEYDRGEDGSGLLRLIHYPSGYKSMLSRPGALMLLGLDFIHFQMVNIANPELPREDRERMARDFQARMLWSWSHSMPRELRDVAEDLHLNVSEDDTTFEVLARQRQEVPWQEALFYNLWFAYPLALVAVVLVAGTVILFAISWRARSAQSRNWRERMERRG